MNNIHKSIRGRKIHIVWWYGTHDTNTSMLVFQDKEDAIKAHDDLLKRGNTSVLALREEEIK